MEQYLEIQLQTLAETIDGLAGVVEELAKTHPSKSSAEELINEIAHLHSVLSNVFDLSDNN